MPQIHAIENGRFVRQSPDQSHCDVAGCRNPHRMMGYCNAHYEQLRDHGKITRTETVRHLRGLSVREKFEENTMPIPFCGCWAWIGECQKDGTRPDHKRYGLLRHGPAGAVVRKKAHRLAWELFRGEIPEGLDVLHKCDNPWCVNPDHLFLGTHLDNMRDMVSKGRAHWQKQRNAMKEGL